MRTAETELRSRLRFLQVARLEGWEVATQFLKVTDGTTDDPAVIEARKAVAKNKKDKDEGNTPSKLGKNFAGQPTGNLNKWPRGGAQHQGPDYEQAVGYPFAGASVYPPPCTTTSPLHSNITGSKGLHLNGPLLSLNPESLPFVSAVYSPATSGKTARTSTN